ncbi:MAG: hypothetical protein K9H64_02990 [Bacteroidales bacterium]|nr:hypothetical protein [Bacteroidales bacterium]MCF8454492.1 hypothetical protein [Bacteroidales bacterium]
MVQTNIPQAIKIGQLIKNYKVRSTFLNRPFLSNRAEPELKLRTIFYAVAICHQTYNLAMPEKNLFGWDVLEKVFLQMLRKNDFLLMPGIATRTNKKRLPSKLRYRFQTNRSPNSCTLDRLDERANLLIDLDAKLQLYFEGSISHLLEMSNSRLLNNGKGLYELLEIFEAFSDPFKKKSSFLIKLLEDAGLFQMADPENYIPIMDYHMQRVLLRTGCVEIRDDGLAKKLRNKILISDDSQIREACIEAMRVIARESGHPIAAMNDFFWPLGRSCCNEKPLCVEGVCEKLPCSLTQLITLDHPHPNCILEKACKGISDILYRNFWQPIVETHFY